jgi:hypothetical protein
MRPISRASATALVTAALALGAPAAHAGPGDAFQGGCQFETVSSAAPDTWTGTLYVLGVATHEGRPTQARVGCEVRVNGVVQNPSSHGSWSGYGVVAGAQPLTFVQSGADLVELCQSVTFDGDTVDQWSCSYPTVIQVPPETPPVIGPLLDALGALIVEHVDPTVCAELVAHPGTYGPVVIAGDGDLYADGVGLLWDCPPYNPV